MSTKGDTFNNPKHFSSQAVFRNWLRKNHKKRSFLWIGFYKKASGKTGMSYKEGLLEAICFGWIDGIKKTVDEQSYTHRFSPRQKTSQWSAVNTKLYHSLKKQGKIQQQGKIAFEQGKAPTTSRDFRRLSAPLERKFKAIPSAWSFFQSTTAGYKKKVFLFVMSAKKQSTQLERLSKVIEASTQKTKLPF